MSDHQYNYLKGSVDDKGYEYEHQMVVYTIVAACNQPDNDDFWVGNNMDGVGGFDDVVLYTASRGGQKRLQLIQLKHTKSNDSVNLGKIQVTKYVTPFKINRTPEEEAKYNAEVIKNAQQRATSTLIARTGVKKEHREYLLVTNASIVQSCTEVTVIDYNSFIKTRPTGIVYEYTPAIIEKDNIQPYFLNQFRILSDQLGLKELSKQEMNSKGLSIEDGRVTILEWRIVEEFAVFFKNRYFRKNLLQITKKLIEMSKSWLVQWTVMTAMIEPFQLVIVENLDAISGNFFESNKSHHLLSCKAEYIDVVLKCLKMNTQLKVIMQKSDVLMNSLNGEPNLTTCTSFNLNLSQFFNQLGNCGLLLQGRKISFQDVLCVAPDIALNFTVDNLLKLLSDKLTIGEASTVLDNYVSRSISRIFIKKSILWKKINSFFILIAETNIKEYSSRLKTFWNAYTSQSDLASWQSTSGRKNEANFCVIQSSEIDAKQTLLNTDIRYESVHILTLHKFKSDIILEWVSSNKFTFRMEVFIEKDTPTMQPITEKDMHDLLTLSKKIILVANPGMGKSHYLKQLSNKYSVDYWVVLVILNEINYKKIRNFQLYLEHYSKEFDAITKQIFDAHEKKKSLIVLFDGFDEVAPLFVEEASTIIQECIKSKQKVVVTSRKVTKTVLEKQLNVLSYSIQSFSDDDKIAFFEKYFLIEMRKKNFSESDLLIAKPKIEEFTRELLNTCVFSSWDTNFTSVPLQCQMLGECFVDRCIKYCTDNQYRLADSLPKQLNLITLYEDFTDKKIDILVLEKRRRKRENLTALEEQDIYDQKEEFIKEHMIAAVQIIFPSVGQNITETYLIRITEGKERHGIITGIDSNKNPIFIHRTFAEYFAAKWLVQIKNNVTMENRTEYLNNLLQPENNVVRDLFDRILCKDCELHTAVLNADKEEMLKLWEQNGGEGENICGRSALHLLCARGARHEVEEKEEEEKVEVHNRRITRKVTKTIEKESHLELLEALVSVGFCNVGMDQVLSWTPQQYAEDRRAFGLIDMLLKYPTVTTVLYDVDQSFLNDWTTDDLLEVCSKYDYLNIVAKFVDSSLFDSKETEKWMLKCTKNDSSLLAEKLVQCHGLQKVDLIPDKAILRRGSLVLNTPNWLHEACRSESMSVLLLLSKGAKLFHLDVKRRTSVDWAIISSNKESMYYVTSFEVLKAHYEDNINALLGGCTALQWALKAGNLESVRQLIGEGATATMIDGIGCTLIHLTCSEEWGNVEVLQLLYEAGVKLDVQELKEGQTALHMAAWRGKLDIVKKLVQLGAKTGIQDMEHYTALSLAGEFKKKETFLYLWSCTTLHTNQDCINHVAFTKDLTEEEARRATFVNCPVGLAALRDRFVVAGFYYRGTWKESTFVQCFSCDCQLSNWQSSADPWVHHAQRNRHCAHVFEHKGQLFIDFVNNN